MFGKLARSVYRAMATESSHETSAEIVAYMNGAIAIGFAAGIVFGAGISAWASVPIALGVFVALRLSLCSRYTVWISALLGVVLAAAGGGGLGWLLGAASDTAYGSTVGAALGAALGSVAPAIAYGSFIKRRLGDQRDSLLPSVSRP